jgi:DNA-directed RNA polymerase subunit M/transcription elongation factor TFIIS
MKFCKNCNNMYYLRISDTNDNKLNYYCRHCGDQADEEANEGVPVLEYNSKGEQFGMINSYIKYDPTLPRVWHMKCPNDNCKTNENTDSDTEIIFMRYDSTDLKNIYTCPSCDTTWKSK